MIISLLKAKNLLFFSLYLLFFHESDLILRFSLINTFYLILRGILNYYFQDLANVPLKLLGFGLSGAFCFWIPASFLHFYGWIVRIFGNLTKFSLS